MSTKTREPDVGELLAAIEPYAWAEDPLAVQYGRCHVHAIIRPELGHTDPRALRAYLLGRADDMVAAMETVSWHLLGAWRTEVRTQSRGPGMTLDGKALRPADQAYITCEVWLDVVYAPPA